MNNNKNLQQINILSNPTPTRKTDAGNTKLVSEARLLELIRCLFNGNANTYTENEILAMEEFTGVNRIQLFSDNGGIIKK